MSILRFRAFSSPLMASAAATISLTSLPALSAHAADVKFVTNTTITSTGQQAGMMGGNANRNFTTTTYIKGNKTRAEVGGQQITITDASTGTVYTLNPAAKTYTMTNINTTLDQAQGMMAMMEFKASGDVKPGGRTKVILGKPARNYLVSANITMGFKAGAKPGGASAPQIKTGVPLMTMKIQGEQWASEAVKLPSSASLANVRLMQTGFARIPGLKNFAATMTKIKGLPLEGTSTQQMTMNMGAAMGGQNPNASGVKPTVTTIKTQTVSLSEAPLPDSLFSVPAGYQKVNVPSRRPMMGAPGGGGAPRPMPAN